MQAQAQNDADDEDQAAEQTLEKYDRRELLKVISEADNHSNSALFISLEPDEELYVDYDDENFDIFNPDLSLKKRRKDARRPSATAFKSSNARNAAPYFIAATSTGDYNEAAPHLPAATKAGSDNANDKDLLGWQLLSKLGYNRKSGKGLGAMGHEGIAEAIPVHQKKVERAGLGHRDALARTQAGRVEKKSAEQKRKDKMARRANDKAREAAKKRRDALLYKAFYDPKHLDLSGI
jgi:hypothetical protein